MKVVDATVFKRVAVPYMDIPQPMYVFHQTDELTSHLRSEVFDREIDLIYNIHDYMNLFKKYKINVDYNPNHKYISLLNYEVWIKTVDEYVPSYADKSGKIFYEQDEKGDFKPTSGCWIRLYAVIPTPTRHVLFSSSGVHTVGINKWDMTAAIRPDLVNEKDDRFNKDKEQVYKEKLEKILSKKKPTVAHFKTILAMFNSDAENGFDLNKILHTTFKSVRADDRKQILNSIAFKEALMQSLQVMFPTLKQAFKDKFKDQFIAEKVAEILQKSIEKEDSAKALDVVKFIMEVGYQENQITNSPDVPLLPIADPNRLALTGNEINPVTTDPVPEEVQEEELKQLRKDHSYPESFVMPETIGLGDFNEQMGLNS